MIFQVATILLYLIGAYSMNRFIPYVDEQAEEDGVYVPLHYKIAAVAGWPLLELWYLFQELTGRNNNDDGAGYV